MSYISKSLSACFVQKMRELDHDIGVGLGGGWSRMGEGIAPARGQHVTAKNKLTLKPNVA